MARHGYLFSIALAALVGPLWLAGAAAQEPDCGSPQTQLDMTQCASEDYRIADAELNARYGAVMRRYESNEEGRRMLQDAQRAWIRFRDAECALATLSVRGGSIEPMIRAQCLQELTETRARQLEELAQCEEGDLSCL
ncbi:lysozyme inhibitor LprI family protein [Nitratireductor sp. GISD-1A_MAKvit]|uniref:lysozyme inhibitor LprI family protein n=1 Tax=Nitratireductor sp. GISD-1A_MAKvit TaxID=3234198 RepID=UPI0034668F7B